MENPQQPPVQTHTYNLPFIHIGGFSFILISVIAIDRDRYLEETDPEKRIITLYLQDNIEHDFAGDAATQFNQWFLQLFNPSGVKTVKQLIQET